MAGQLPLFPLPEVEHRLQLLLEHTLAMNGLLVVTEARYGVSLQSAASSGQQPDPVDSIRFVPFAKIEAFNSVLRRRPDGASLAEQICSLLLDHYGSTAKPVLLLRRNGHHWLGMIDYSPESRERDHRIGHLMRCLAAS
jgi:hypothetical protein